jgi:signal transduction histidine kinase
MNPISAFFVRHIVAVFFSYGLAFFAMGLALALASRRASEFRFARAIRPLAAFGILHGLHEWIEMYQKIATLTSGYVPTTSQEILRLAVLVASFLSLSAFGVALLGSQHVSGRRVLLFVAGMLGVWLVSVLIVQATFEPSGESTIAFGDVLARYVLGIPGALLGAWAMMTQQRTFREYGMPQFGRDLVWCATALLMYGVIGQIFVRQSALVPSNVLNSTRFLQWFGVPVQLFRGVMATVLAVFMVRALNAFEFEGQRRLQTANQARLQAQQAALESERRVSREMEHLNVELQLTTHELALLLSLSNLLATPMSLMDRLRSVLEKIVGSLEFPEAGMSLLISRRTAATRTWASVGCNKGEESYIQAQDLGQQCVKKAVAMCRHADGGVVEFPLEEALDRQRCQRYASPVSMISLPLMARGAVIGSIVLSRKQMDKVQGPSQDEFRLMMGIAQQLGLSLENARLYEDAQEREKLLGELLHQAVGAQEAERQRIARELHDATGQSLTAIALGLRGAEAILEKSPDAVSEQIRDLRSFTTDALGELRELIADLRPSQLDDLGLVAALEWYVQEFQRRYHIPTDFTVKGSRRRLPSEYETVLFRITQEALSNIAKHARADHASVRLVFAPNHINLKIRDNGCGFNPDRVLSRDGTHTGWGLLGIRERASLIGGKHDITSRPGRGTVIRVQIPLVMENQDVKDPLITG